ncbi:hypothetical protein N7489_002239 [Penicillium chrysogenum]|uniref:DNA repair protein RAD51 homolog 3 n=1 Tax=Penicillium chrysogenum TaxID=5076 RepID=A0ABQ8WL41_PENCH|nr:uncharacterized protein N7489_002239 [Penicillium chrysogenum]KAJ5251829.1 hypothetical protein N7489_002239 [Penicillium chrysogenum]KAJ5270737.1 hypothetical protein N7505_006495 [Penicillium chrysogenum]
MSINMDLLGLDGLEGFDDGDTPPVVSISASQSLNASAATRHPIATGLARLDEVLNDLPDQPDQGGILRGHVTEIFGPPGAGKTSLAMNIACNALRDGKVVWIDTGCPLPTPRLEEMSINLDDFIYFRAHTLAHLIALLARPPKGFPPSETSLIVVDSVSNLFSAYFPSAQELKDQLAEGKITDKAHLQWLINRRWNVASELGTHLARLAARNIAVVAINQSHTKVKGQSHAVLQPLLSGGAWEASVQTRIAVYRDLPDERLAEVEKRAGKPLPEQAGELLVAFRIEPDGLYEMERKDSVPSESLTPLPKSPDFEYYDPPTPTPSPISSVLSSAPPSPKLESPKPPSPKPMSPEKPVQIPNKKRKVEEVADSQDEDSEEEDVPWTNEITLNTNQS